MLKIENTEVTGWEAAIRGMRNPMNSWKKSDSRSCGTCGDCDICIDYDNCPFDHDGHKFVIGPNDLDLMARLRNSGTDHRKFMRMITVYIDILAPLYWWKEFDTYKVGTVANSCSTMHKIHEKEFTMADFSCEHLMEWSDYENDIRSFEPDRMCNFKNYLLDTISALNNARDLYLLAKTKPMKEEANRAELVKKFWWQMIQLLPSSYNQKRTVMLNYEVLANIYKSRRNHKLDEWHIFCGWIESLPYSELITGEEK
jgi:hypothetical protein